MKVIDVTDDFASACRKIRLRCGFEVIGFDDPPVDVRHARLDVLAEHELVAALVQFDGSYLPGPLVHVLKQVAMNGLEMRKIRIARWNALSRSLSGHVALEGVQLRSILDAEPVTKNGRSGINVRIAVHSAASGEAKGWNFAMMYAQRRS
jgi:hypothetical protein